MAELENNTADKKEKSPKKPGFFSKLAAWFKRVIAWFKSLRPEMKKISWATAETVRHNTLIVIICVVILSIALGVIDYLLSSSIVGLSNLI